MSYGIYIVLKDFIITTFEIFCLLIFLGNEKEKCWYGKYIFAIVLIMVSVISTYLYLPVFIKMVIIEIMIIFVGRMVYKCSKIKLGIYGGIYLLISLGCELVVVQGWNFFNDPIYSTNIIKEDFVWTLVILSKSLHFIIIVSLNKILYNMQNIKKISDGLPTVLLSFPFLIAMSCLYIGMPQIQDNKYRIIFLVSDICIFGAFISNVIFTQHYISIMQQRREEDATIYELTVKNEYYLKKLSTDNEVREIYHDLKNHFLISKDSYINKELVERLETYESYYETGNDFLNIILTDKMNRAKKLGIEMECEVDFSKGSFMEPLDISTVFGNILDNAIEACHRIENEEEKIIFFRCAARGNFLSIAVKNSMLGYDKAVRTVKKNKKFHGYGLLNVDKVLQHYNGEMSIEAEEKEFILSIIIPIKEESK